MPRVAVIVAVMVPVVVVLMRMVVVVSGRIAVVLPERVLMFVLVLEGAMVVRMGVTGDGHHRIRVPPHRREFGRCSWPGLTARRA
jgi:hypothetical protein